jgi:hypothetical protein
MATSKEDMQDTKLNFRRFEDGDQNWRGMGNKIFNEDKYRTWYRNSTRRRFYAGICFPSFY